MFFSYAEKLFYADVCWNPSLGVSLYFSYWTEPKTERQWDALKFVLAVVFVRIYFFVPLKMNSEMTKVWQDYKAENKK